MKSIPYSMALVKERIAGGRLLDVGGAEMPTRANQLSTKVDEVVLLDLKHPTLNIAENVTVVVQPIESADESLGLFDHIHCPRRIPRFV